MRRIVGCGAAALVFVGGAARADDQVVMAHSGRLFDGTDAPVSATLKLSFRIVDQSAQVSSEKELWSSGACTVSVEKGFYSVVLGSGECGTGLTAQMLPLAEQRYLEVAIDQVKLSPRLRLSSAPTAVLAGNALNLGGKAAESYAQKSDVQQAVTDLTAQLATKFAAAGGTIGGNTVVQGTLQAGATTVDSLTATGTISGKIAGDGSALTKLAAAQLTGTVADANLSQNVALLSDGQTFLGTKTFTNLTASGTITGKHAGDGSALTGVKDDTRVLKSGDTMTGALTVNAGSGTAINAQGNVITNGFLVVNGSAGIGANPPATKLDVAGAVKIGTDTRDCTSALAGAIRFNGTMFEGCDGNAWQRILAPSGKIQALAGRSCRRIKEAYPSSTDGTYWVDPDGGDTGNAVQIYCDMTFDGGGWTTIANTKRPANDNVDKITVPNTDMQRKDPQSINRAIWKWAGEAWTEFLVECRAPTPADQAARWVFVRDMQPVVFQQGLDQLVLNADNHWSGLGGSGNIPCIAKHMPNASLFCGHNNNGSESDWGDGLQIGSSNPVWAGLYFGSTDSQNQKKCNLRTSYSYTDGNGSIPDTAIYTYRIR